MNKVLCILLVLLVGCVGSGIATETPSQNDQHLCPGIPGDGFEVLNDNPCLEGAMRTEGVGGVVQWRPELHTVISIPGTIEGYENENSGHAEIGYDGDYVFDVLLINGEWGFELPSMIIPEGCIGFKFIGVSSVENDGDEDLSINAFVSLPTSDERLLIGSSVLEYDAEFESFWSLRMNSAQILTPSFTIVSRWGGGKNDSTITIKTLVIALSPSGYCDGEVVELG